MSYGFSSHVLLASLLSSPLTVAVIFEGVAVRLFYERSRSTLDELPLRSVELGAVMLEQSCPERGPGPRSISQTLGADVINLPTTRGSNAIDEELGLMATLGRIGSSIQKYSELLRALSFVDVTFECSQPRSNASATGHAATSRPHNLL